MSDKVTDTPAHLPVNNDDPKGESVDLHESPKLDVSDPALNKGLSLDESEKDAEVKTTSGEADEETTMESINGQYGVTTKDKDSKVLPTSDDSVINKDKAQTELSDVVKESESEDARLEDTDDNRNELKEPFLSCDEGSNKQKSLNKEEERSNIEGSSNIEKRQEDDQEALLCKDDDVLHKIDDAIHKSDYVLHKSDDALHNSDYVDDINRSSLHDPEEGIPRSFEPPDGGWGWLVCFASFWTNGTLFGLLNCFGILFVEFLEEFSEEGSDAYFKLSWIGALQIATTFFMSMFSSILVDMFGIQLMSGIGAVIAASGMLISSFVNSIEALYFTYGIMIGLGSSFIYTPSMTILGHYFKKKLGLVNGIVAFGSAVFTFVLSFLLPYLLRTVGLRNAMRVLCVLLASLVVCPFIWRPIIPKEVVGLETIRSTESVSQKCGGCLATLKRIFNTEMFKVKGYRIWIIGVPIAFMGYFIPFVHIVEHTKQVFPGHNAEALVMCIGGISGISRLVSGKLADYPQFNRVWIQQFSFVMLGVTTSLIPFAGQYGVLIFLACMMGIGDGCFICMLGPIAYDLLGPQGMGQGIGVLFGLMSVPMTIGPPLAGFLRGLMGTYKVAFLIAGLPPIVGACILFLMPQATKIKPSKLITMTDTIVSMSRDHLDRLDRLETLDRLDDEDEEEMIDIKVSVDDNVHWPRQDTNTTDMHEHESKEFISNGNLHSSKEPVGNGVEHVNV